MSVHYIVKKYEKIQLTLRVDSVTDEYIINIPEQIVNEMNWYEDTDIFISLQGDGVFLETDD